MLRSFTARPRLTGAILFGAAVGLGLAVIPNPLRVSTRVVFTWDALLVWFIGSTLLMMAECDETRIRQRAAKEDEGQHFILGLAIVAAVASIVAIAKELSLAKLEPNELVKGLRVALAFGTVLGSWLFVQMVFALHYAHEYYDAPRGEGHSPDECVGGLAFPGDERPDYWDFLHFGAVIGVAAQTADVAFTSKSMRHTGTIHAMVAFIFNTVVLALTINLLAALF